jgi:hypothetical protein
LYDLAREGIHYDCGCDNSCLANLGANQQESLIILQTYMRDWCDISRQQHRERFLSLLQGMTTGWSPGGRRQGKLHLSIGTKQYPVCRKAFAFAHCRRETYYDDVGSPFSLMFALLTSSLLIGRGET